MAIYQLLLKIMETKYFNSKKGIIFNLFKMKTEDIETLAGTTNSTIEYIQQIYHNHTKIYRILKIISILLYHIKIIISLTL